MNEKFAKSLELDYPILSDPGKNIAQAYGVVHKGRTLPERWTFYVSAQGKILFIDQEVKPASHGKDCVAKLKELKIPTKS